MLMLVERNIHNMAAFNTFSVLKPMFRDTYAMKKIKNKKIKGFKGPPSMPKEALSVVTKLSGGLKAPKIGY